LCPCVCDPSFCVPGQAVRPQVGARRPRGLHQTMSREDPEVSALRAPPGDAGRRGRSSKVSAYANSPEPQPAAGYTTPARNRS
jgi:hypothetical protein